MKTAHYFLAVSFLAFAGCSSTTMTVDSTDAAGRSTRKVYSKYYDAATWLVPRRLGMSIVVDHQKTRIPIVSGVQQSLGALRPSDAFANGKVTVYLWNFDSQPQLVKILAITSPGQAFTSNGRIINAAPRVKTGGAAGNLKILDSGTSIPIKVQYEWNGKRAIVELKLARRTDEELFRYFGPNGKPPYPWLWYGGSDQLR